jgi:hypothetical protein
MRASRMPIVASEEVIGLCPPFVSISGQLCDQVIGRADQPGWNKQGVTQAFFVDR